MPGKYKIEIKWGVIFFIMTLVWMFLEKTAGLHDQHIDKHPVYTNLVAIPAIAIYVFALLEKKRSWYAGSMNYMQGFISGLIITLVVTILSPLAQLITSHLITPDYFTNAIEYAVETDKMGRTEAEQYFNTTNYIVQGLVGTPVMGIITSAVVALFTRSKQ